MAATATPLIHLNGSPFLDLVHYWQEAAVAIRKAQDALEVAAPNGRDYYIRGDFSTAQREHEERFAALRKIAADIQTIRESLAEQER